MPNIVYAISMAKWREYQCNISNIAAELCEYLKGVARRRCIYMPCWRSGVGREAILKLVAPSSKIG